MQYQHIMYNISHKIYDIFHHFDKATLIPSGFAEFMPPNSAELRHWHPASDVILKHYCEIMMDAMASQHLAIINPTVYSGAHQRKHQSYSWF